MKAETKLLIFFFYFAIASALSLVLIIVGSRNATQEEQGFMEYFACKALGEDPENPCLFTVDRREGQAFTIASLAFYAMGPYAALVYVIPLDKIKERWAIRSKSTQNSISTS